MMDYEIFKCVVEDKFMGFLPEEYHDHVLMINPVNKINRTFDGLTVTKDVPGVSVSPTIYVNDMYEDYLKTEDLDAILKMYAEGLVDSMDQIADNHWIVDAEFCKRNVIFNLINTAQNSALLAEVPHRAFNDLSVIYCVVIDLVQDNTMILSNALAGDLGLTEEMLYDLAMVNTRRILPPEIDTLDNHMSDIFPELALVEAPLESQLFFVGNERAKYGAANMLYEDIFDDLSEKIGTDLYIMPSSVHEVLAISVKHVDPTDLVQLVSFVNENALELKDKLSNQIYLYDRKQHKVMLVTEAQDSRDDAADENVDKVSVTNEYGVVIEFEKAVGFMDDVLREEIHEELAPCTEQDFFDEYAKRHEQKFGEKWVLAEENPCY